MHYLSVYDQSCEPSAVSTRWNKQHRLVYCIPPSAPHSAGQVSTLLSPFTLLRKLQEPTKRDREFSIDCMYVPMVSKTPPKDTS